MAQGLPNAHPITRPISCQICVPTTGFTSALNSQLPKNSPPEILQVGSKILWSVLYFTERNVRFICSSRKDALPWRRMH
jgi:hypothetical protein